MPPGASHGPEHRALLCSAGPGEEGGMLFKISAALWFSVGQRSPKGTHPGLNALAQLQRGVYLWIAGNRAPPCCQSCSDTGKQWDVSVTVAGK